LENWLSKAVDTFPELADQFERADLHPMSFWIELRLALDKAYQCNPINEDLIGRIYGYASWCFDQPETDSAETDLGTAVVVCLIEHLPETQAVAADLYRWMSTETFEGFESVFRYHFSEEQYLTFRDDFMRKKRTYSGPSRL
jgi:hypothetical protein